MAFVGHEMRRTELPAFRLRGTAAGSKEQVRAGLQKSLSVAFFGMDDAFQATAPEAAPLRADARLELHKREIGTWWRKTNRARCPVLRQYDPSTFTTLAHLGGEGVRRSVHHLLQLHL